MISPRFAWTFLFSLTMLGGRTYGAVSAYEKEITIPMWAVSPPRVHPTYLDGERRIYPYPMLDLLTDKKADKKYRAVFLENEYVQVLILPEIGGRLHGASPI